MGSGDVYKRQDLDRVKRGDFEKHWAVSEFVIPLAQPGNRNGPRAANRRYGDLGCDHIGGDFDRQLFLKALNV